MGSVNWRCSLSPMIQKTLRGYFFCQGLRNRIIALAVKMIKEKRRLLHQTDEETVTALTPQVIRIVSRGPDPFRLVDARLSEGKRSQAQHFADGFQVGLGQSCLSLRGRSGEVRGKYKPEDAATSTVWRLPPGEAQQERDKEGQGQHLSPHVLCFGEIVSDTLKKKNDADTVSPAPQSMFPRCPV